MDSGMRIGKCVARRVCGLRGWWVGCRRLVWEVGGVVGGGGGMIACLVGLGVVDWYCSGLLEIMYVVV